MGKISGLFAAMFLVLAPPANGEESTTITTETTSITSECVVPPATSASTRVFDLPMYLSLNTGLVRYSDAAGNGESRLLTSVLLDWNLAHGRTPPTPIQYGFESGLLFSHVSSPQATFFGADPEGGPGAGSSLFVVPLNLWAGYHFQGNALLAIHTGANLFMRTDTRSMRLGRNDGDDEGSADFLPDIGLQAAWVVGRNVALSLRGDWTLSPSDTIFTGMLGATIPIA